jgi:hypothetical protein
MATMFELLGDTAEEAQPVPQDTSPGQFQQGLRSGFAGAQSSLQGFAGSAAEAAGYSDFARERFAAARAAQAEAQAQAPRVHSYEDVHDLRSGWDYMTGLLGQSVPQSAVAIGGGLLGKTPVGRMVGATLATTPMEAGDIGMRQQADPTALANTTPGERFGQQLTGGALSAGAQSILPGIVAGKIAGAGTRGVGASLRAGLTELPGAVALEGGTEALGEAAKQATLMRANPARPWDTQALAEAGIGGAVAGGGMHAVGTVGEVAQAATTSAAHGAPGRLVESTSNALTGAVDRARGLMAPKGQAEAADATAGAPGAGAGPSDPAGEIKGIYDAGKRQARDLWESIANNETVEAALAKAGKTADEIKAMIPQALTERAQAVQAEIGNLWENKGLSDEQRAKLSEARKDPMNAANQAYVASLKFGTEQGKKFAEKAGKAFEAFKAALPRAAKEATKKSEDYSGIEKAIGESLLPALEKASPGIMADPPALKKAAKVLRLAVEAYKTGGREQLSSTQVAHLIDLFGDEAVNVMDAAYQTIYSDKVGSAEREKFYGALDEMRMSAKEEDKTFGLMQRSLLPALQETTRTTDIAEELKVLRRAVRSIEQDSNEGRVRWGILKGDMELRYGGKAEAILKAIEKEPRSNTENAFAKSGAKVDDSEHEAEEGYEPVPDADDLAYEDMSHLADKDVDNAAEALDYGPEDGTLTTKGSAQALAARERAVKQNPDRTVRFVTGKQLGEKHPRVAAHMNRIMQDLQSEGMDPDAALAQAKATVQELGYVVAEGTRVPGTIHKGNVKRVTIAGDEEAEGGKKAKRAFYDTKAKFKVGNTAFDAIRLTGEMNKQFGTEWTDSDNQQPDAYRSGRMFLIGLAALGDHLGQKIEVDDKLVIDHKGTTYGDVKNLDVRTNEDKALDAVREQLHDLRVQFRATTAMLKDAIAKKADDETVVDLKATLKALKEDAESLLDPMNYDRDRELARGADIAGRSRGTGKASQQQYIEALLHQGHYGVVNPGPQTELRDPSYEDRGIAYVTDKDGNTQKLRKKGLARRPEAASNRYDADGNLTKAGLDALLQGDNHGGIQTDEVGYKTPPTQRGERTGRGVAEAVQNAPGPQVRALRKRIAKIEALIEGSDNKEGRRLARARVNQLTKTLRVLEAADARTSVDDESGMGQHEVDPFGPTHIALRGKGEAIVRTAKGVTAKSTPAEKIAGTNVELVGDEKGKVYTDSTGAGRSVRPAYGPDAETKAKSGPVKLTGDVLRDKFNAWVKDPPSAAAKVIAERGIALLDNKHLLNPSGKKALAALLSKGKRPSDVRATIEALWDKHGAKIEGTAPEVAAKGPKGEGLKYSLLSTRIHNELGRSGFAATHDSPLKHEGRFDWRKNKGKGEGHAAFGAGTYLSTAEGVHHSYKKQFTAKTGGAEVSIDGKPVVPNGASPTERAIREAVVVRHRNPQTDAHALAVASAEASARSAVLSTLNEVDEEISKFYDVLDASDDPDYHAWAQEVNARMKEVKKAVGDDDDSFNAAFGQFEPIDTGRALSAIDKLLKAMDTHSLKKDLLQAAEELRSLPGVLKEIADFDFARARMVESKSPTYEVSVDIGEDQLLDWNKPLTEHPKAISDAIIDSDLVQQAYDDQFPNGDLLYATGDELYRSLAVFLKSQSKASDYLQSIGILGHRFAAGGGKNDTHPNYVIYDDSKITTNYVHMSQQSGVSPRRATQQDMQAIRAYVDKVLGPQVAAAMSNIAHAGDYDTTRHAMRVSVHALNPTTVAYHEALHGFFAYLIAQGNTDVARALERAAMSSPIQAQLRKLLANEQDALDQLSDPEEAAAYMYQFWAAGQLKIGDRTRNVFERIRDAIAKVFGIWSTDQRAEAILDYFHSGEFKTQGLGQPNAVTRALMEPGRNAVLEWVKDKTSTLNDALDALTIAGSQRLRDTGVPALRELANLMKASGRFATDDEGYIPAARAERNRVLNEFGAQLRGYTDAQLDDALAAMQSGNGPGAATTPEGRLAARVIEKTLADMLAYMKAAGVDTGKIQPRANYFPRLYDAGYISRHQNEFQAVLETKGGLSPREAKAITLHLMASDGAEFTVEVDRPGMQFLKPRVLAMIDDADLAPFTRKNLFEIMGSYITQATRRAEWAQRFKDDGSGLTDLLDKAKAEGATPAQMDTAHKFVRAVDGTLGDTLSPGARRIMGNIVVYQNWRLLPLAIFSSIVDPMGIMVRGGTVSDAWDTFKRGIREIPKAFKKAYTYDADTQLAESLGVIEDAMLSDTTGQLYTQGMVGDGVRRINDTLFKYNLMEGFNRSMRVGATQAAIKFLQRHRDGTASPHSARWLAELGLKPGFTWDINDDGVRAAINMWVDGAVLRPDSVDKPIWMNDPHFMLIAHLKQFVYSFQETILKRTFHEYMHGNYAPAMALTAYVPIMIASDAIKALLQGGGELPEWKRNWGPSEYLASGIERAGLLGKTQFTPTDPGMLVGPTGQQLFGAMQAIEGKASAGRAAVKALPASVVYAGWLDDGDAPVKDPATVKE